MEASAGTTHLRALLGAGSTERHTKTQCAHKGSSRPPRCWGARRFGKPSWKSWDSMQALKGGLHLTQLRGEEGDILGKGGAWAQMWMLKCPA